MPERQRSLGSPYRALAAIALWAVFCQPAFADEPLFIKNTFPLVMAAGAPSIERAGLQNSVTLGLSHSSTHMVWQSADWDVGIDLETTVLTYKERFALWDKTELGLDIPIINHGSGFMDSPLASYHDAFGFPDYGRSKRPDDDFLFYLRQNGETIVEGDAGKTSLGDIRLGAKRLISEGENPVSLYGYLDLPTGSPEDGFGSGTMEEGIALLIDSNAIENFSTTVNLGYVFTDSLDAYEKISLRDFFYAGFDAGWDYSEDAKIHVQYMFQTSPMPHTGLITLDRPVNVLSVGGSFDMDGGRIFEIYFTEDPSTSGAPDFIIGFNCVIPVELPIFP